LISDIQRCYLDHEIGFLKKRKINDPGLIRINKVFCFERLAPDIFKDLEDEHTFYVSIPSHLNWSLFRKVTENVKNNIANSNFDCASGFVYLKTILELVRIYTHSTDVNRLQIIRSKYLEEIEKIRET
jgi:hypothetical protein